jgi:hypothetical protein
MTQLNQHRMNEVCQAIKDASAAIDRASVGRDDAAWSANTTLQATLAALIQFATDGRNDIRTRAQKLEASIRKDPQIKKILERYPPQYAEHLILEQALFDLRVLWHIHMQRALQPHLRATITLVEDAARIAIQQAVAMGVLKQSPKVLVYLQKSPSVRIMPYADLVLIGMPFWLYRVDEPQPANALIDDLLAVPHEIGHYVYWRGKARHSDQQSYTIARLLKQFVQGTFSNPEYPSVARQVSSTNRAGALVTEPSLTWRSAHGVRIQDTLKRWSEEAFADVFAYSVSGVASIASLMDVALNRSWKEPFTDLYDDHPTPLVRPLTLLELAATHDQASAAHLNNVWLREPLVAASLASRAAACEGCPIDPSGDTSALFDAPDYSTDSVYSALVRTSKYCADLLGTAPPKPKISAKATTRTARTSPPVSSANETKALLSAWRAGMTDKLKTIDHAARDLALPPVPHSWTSWLDGVVNEYQALNLSYITDPELLRWVCAISAGGWTEGPTNGGNRPG